MVYNENRIIIRLENDSDELRNNVIKHLNEMMIKEIETNEDVITATLPEKVSAIKIR